MNLGEVRNASKSAYRAVPAGSGSDEGGHELQQRVVVPLPAAEGLVPRWLLACTVGKVLMRKVAPCKDRGRRVRVFVAFSLGERGGAEEGAISRSISANAHRTHPGAQLPSARRGEGT